MKKILIMCLIALGMIFTSCATIVNTPNYKAKVVVKNSQNTEIYINNEYHGTDSVSFLWKRKMADKLSIKLKEENYKEQVFNYNTKDFTAWTLLGDIFVFGGVPGILVDAISGSWYRPDTNVLSVKQLNGNTFLYELIYDKCPIKKEE